LDAARAALNEGREAARALREQVTRTEAGFLADEARVDRLQLNYDSACAKFAEAARLDPDNVWLWIELGDLWTMRGSLAEAKKALSASREAASRNGNDRDLSVAHNRIGDTQVTQGDLAGALKSFRDGLVIAERLTQSNPDNVGWQHDLSVSYEKMGDVQVAQGDLAGGLKSYRDRFAIADRLAQSDPGNAGWQRDLSVSYTGLATCRSQRAISPARSSPIATAWRSETAWRNPIPATPAGGEISRCRTIRLATCRRRKATSPARSSPIATASRSETAWRNPIPATPAAARSRGVVREDRGCVQKYGEKRRGIGVVATRPGDHGSPDRSVAGQRPVESGP
jgi:tetratricopeptide (TPR) repeat protein